VQSAWSILPVRLSRSGKKAGTMFDHPEETLPQWWLAYGAAAGMALIPLMLLALSHW
jgi:hypothetical protein